MKKQQQQQHNQRATWHTHNTTTCHAGSYVWVFLASLLFLNRRAIVWEREEKTNTKLALPPSHTLLSKSTPTMRCTTIVVYFYTRPCVPILTLGESWLQGQLCWALSKVVCSPKISITLRISRINKTVSSENKHIPPPPTTSSTTHLPPTPKKKKIPKTVLLFFFFNRNCI